MREPIKKCDGGSGIAVYPWEWTEEELDNYRKQRPHHEDLATWKADPKMKYCVQCGYGLQPSWKECPLCETTITSEEKILEENQSLDSKKDSEEEKWIPPSETDDNSDSN